MEIGNDTDLPEELKVNGAPMPCSISQAVEAPQTLISIDSEVTRGSLARLAMKYVNKAARYGTDWAQLAISPSVPTRPICKKPRRFYDSYRSRSEPLRQAVGSLSPWTEDVRLQPSGKCLCKMPLEVARQSSPLLHRDDRGN